MVFAHKSPSKSGKYLQLTNQLSCYSYEFAQEDPSHLRGVFLMDGK
jgi:hypothetical protein